ncbi:MAG: GHKL domain-containing protein [Lachnospiraceae bacterium]|nr:GHKL domain-containing protein [Lachnospiraceae bacterium]
MDTKWKNRKKIVSFLVFFLGVSLALGGLADILRKKPFGTRLWQLGRILEDDYQQSAGFRGYVSDRLSDFLVMATGGEGLWGIRVYEDGTYYSEYGFDADLLRELGGFEVEEWNSPSVSREELADYLNNLKNMEERFLELLEAMDGLEDYGRQEGFSSDLEMYWNEMSDYVQYLEDILPESLSGKEPKSLTEEQKQSIAGKYHDMIKGDRNLLYAVAYDGKVLYSNSDLLGAAGGSAITAYGDVVLPEGYNFLLYFDGEKVRICKDGREIDVYGDGYYREDSDWHVPGYVNFQAGDAVKKAVVCMAVAEEPVLYEEDSYGNGVTRRYDNSLYWMNDTFRNRRQSLLEGFYCLAAGLILLLLAFLDRKNRRKATEEIARIQGKIWLECKILLFLGLLYGLFIVWLVFVNSGEWHQIWEEMVHTYEYNYDLTAAGWLGRELAGSVPPVFWTALFWGLWLFWNDLRHNEKIWRCSLTAKLYRTFRVKGMERPLSRRMSRRNRTVFLAGLIYAAVMLEQVALVDTVWRGENVRIIVCVLAAVETAVFLGILYLTVRRNMEIARDVETLSSRIAEIRDGDYGEQSSRGAGGEPAQSGADSRMAGRGDGAPCRDLEPVMAQLEDIRHGMARAVDDQMKSERMKVELIANVSHDIKTPLTSIISYVEILRQEEGLPDYVKDYVRILDEKAQRLKNMVTDVFAVSKAASGELPIQMEALDLGKLLRQTLADMEEQIGDSGVTFRTDLPDAPVTILADGQRLYRVFQNLFQNAIQYSLQGSRVYVALQTDGRLAVASVKNTSSRELEKGKNFAERFARGDASRTDGGSGLGLSIAQSFTEACGGRFSWETDADLFVVRVAFDILEHGTDPAEAPGEKSDQDTR